MKSHIFPFRIYYEDTDAAGIVNHSNYLKFFCRARTEWLRLLGFELVNLLVKDNAQFVVHKAELEFLQPARLDQIIYVVSEFTEVRAASIRYNQAIHLESPEGTLICRAKIKLACLDRNLKPRGLPALLLQEINKWSQSSH